VRVIEHAQDLIGGGGFVPTMGALHEGHATLLRRSVEENSHTTLSIFVNPTQFGPKEDFSKYPRTLEADLAVAELAGVDYVYVPKLEEIYIPGHSTFIEVQGVSEPWCGKFRPGHFRGVATVVQRLFQLVQPEKAYFGQKDLQQCLVIGRMARDLGLPVKMVAVPTVRESDGLALSSRNRYLSAEERQKATVIFRALEAARLAYEAGERNAHSLQEKVQAVLATTPEFQPQYAEVRSLPNLDAVEQIKVPAAIAIAGYLGTTRLIDNHIF
jgi:pantoate--beta-alanine ligase